MVFRGVNETEFKVKLSRRKMVFRGVNEPEVVSISVAHRK
uniref:Uncharacterized protein n=1 Tax=Tetranychus urticae TaxID=32264 RepID=T1KPH1_TETUR